MDDKTETWVGRVLSAGRYLSAPAAGLAGVAAGSTELFKVLSDHNAMAHNVVIGAAGILAGVLVSVTSGWLFKERKRVLSRTLESVYLAVLVRQIRSSELQSSRKRPEELAISLTYFKSIANLGQNITAILSCAALAGFLVASFTGPPDDGAPLFFLFVPLVVLLLVQARTKILEYRIKSGFFGTNEYEARELIAFIVKNANKIDFKDGDGKLRQALLPEAEGSSRSSSPIGVVQV